MMDFTRVMLSSMVILMGVALASASSEARTNVEGEQRLLYIPITDVLSYNQVIKIGFLLLLVTIMWGLWNLRFGENGPTFNADLLTRRFFNRNGPMETNWTDDWYSWFPILDNLVEGIDKYKQVKSFILWMTFGI